MSEIRRYIDQNFNSVGENISGNVLLEQILNKSSQRIVALLEQIENDWADPFENAELRTLVNTPETAMFSPTAQRKWFAAVCIAASEKHGFSWGNLFVSADDL